MGNTSKNTADAQKAYKKAKKQRRALRKAEQLQQKPRQQHQQPRTENSNTPTKAAWRRVSKEDGAKKAVDRPLKVNFGEEKINQLLEKRSEAKADTNYEVSDEITKTLVGLQIVYDDDKREWHTRAWKSLKPLM